MNRALACSLTAPTLFAAIAIGCAAANASDADRSAQAVAQADSPEQGFVSIFDGESLEGWYAVGGNASYEAVDGVIVGSGDRINQNTFLRTEATYSDFEFRCQFKFVRHSNSGIQYRSQQRLNDAGEAVGRVYGYQYEMDHSARAWTAGLYEEGRRGWLQNVDGDGNAHKREALKIDDWNDVVIRCEGTHIQTWLNGVQVADYVDEADEALLEGFIALQVHSGQDAEIHWRELRIKELGGGE
ncbi:MAG: DUF1080 domain-containing protein [Phycisphaerales bacterium JB063]